MKQLIIQNEQTMRSVMTYAWELVTKGIKAGPVVLTLGRANRTVEQNSKLWPMLTDVSKQVEWYGETLTKENWKDVFTAALKKQKAVPGIDGGFVIIGQSTSKMNKQEFSNLIELIYAFGAERELKWSEPALDAYEKYSEEK